MSSSSADQTSIAERYGRGPRRRPGLLLAGLLVALVALVGWFVWALWAALHPQVSSGLEKWEAVSENEVKATVVVRLHDKDAKPTCSIEAQDDQNETVGKLRFTPTEGRQVVTIPTERKALRVNWDDCTVE